MLFFAACTCPTCPEQVECPDRTDFEKEYFKIDSMKSAAFTEINEFRAAAIYQVDTMRANMFAERDRIVFDLKGDSMANAEFAKQVNFMADSLAGVVDKLVKFKYKYEGEGCVKIEISVDRKTLKPVSRVNPCDGNPNNQI
jgi:hypothetical protein